jgi:hypothetical protein
VFDAGEFFELQYAEGYQLVLKQDLRKESNVFLVDHAWTTDWRNARKQLMENPALVQRLYTMFDLDVEDQANDEEEEVEGEGEEEEEGKTQENAGEKQGEKNQEEAAETEVKSPFAFFFQLLILCA